MRRTFLNILASIIHLFSFVFLISSFAVFAHEITKDNDHNATISVAFALVPFIFGICSSILYFFMYRITNNRFFLIVFYQTIIPVYCWLIAIPVVIMNYARQSMKATFKSKDFSLDLITKRTDAIAFTTISWISIIFFAILQIVTFCVAEADNYPWMIVIGIIAFGSACSHLIINIILKIIIVCKIKRNKKNIGWWMLDLLTLCYYNQNKYITNTTNVTSATTVPSSDVVSV